MNTRTITAKVRYYVDAFADETCVEHDIWFTYPQTQKHVEKLKVRYQEKGADFTNTIEGFWGTLKRMIEGIYHSISSKYLQRYVDEAVYRWNTRRMSGCDSFRYMFKASIGVVDYEMVKQVA